MTAEFRTKRLAIEFSKTCIKIKAPSYMYDQLQKAAYSIALNLAEGSAKNTQKDRHRYYRIALGSFREIEVILEILGTNDQKLIELKKPPSRQSRQVVQINIKHIKKLPHLLTPSPSCHMPHAVCLMPHASCLIPHASCLMPCHASPKWSPFSTFGDIFFKAIGWI